MIYRLLSLLLGSLFPAIVLAQSDAASEEEVIPRYDVEIAIFRNIKVPKSREFILPVSSPNKDEVIFDLSSEASVEAAAEAGYELLGADDFRMLDLVVRLIESPRYQLLLHAGWRQPGLDRDQAMPIWLRGGRIYGNEYTSIDSQVMLFDNKPVTEDGETGEAKTYEFDEQTLESQELQLLQRQQAARHEGLYELEGKITVALSRYLHTYVDLVLRHPRLSSDEELNNAATEAYLQANLADTRILDNHRLQEHRRMRSKNLHYLDNPEFGMLILITPYEVAEGFEEAAIEEAVIEEEETPVESTTSE